MAKAHRDCPNCGTNVHVRKNPCNCGHVFAKKSAAPAQVVTETPRATTAAPKQAQAKVAQTVATPDSSPANQVYTPAQVERIKELQNHVTDLEKTLEKRDKVWEARLAKIETQYKKFYAGQAQLIYQRAFEYFGGKGDLYHSPEHGDNPKLFKAQSDETGVFIPPAVPDRSSEYPEGPATDEMIQKTAEVMISHRTPQERDLKGDGVIIDDVMSFSYATPLEEKEVEAPTLQNAIDHVKFLTGEAQ